MKLFENFLPFGSQYYRAPTPTPDKWDGDLREISGNGFNTIKIFAQWGWNNPSDGVYDFSDIDILMDTAHKYNLKVIINMIFDCAPEWFYIKYPESVMEYADGGLLYPRAVGHRHTGGAPGPCYHHKPGIAVREEFISRIAERYRSHPAMYIWDLWNEPELTCGIARDAGEDKLVCYCGASVKAFREWLQKKYGGIENINDVWHRRYNNIDEIPPPRCGATFNDMIDWRMFFADTITGELKMRADAVKRFDQSHPVMAHIVPLPYFNMATACCDDYAMAELCDLFGNSIGSAQFAAAWTTSAANGKICINSEIHAMGGSTLNPPAIPSFGDFTRHIFIPLSYGVKGFIFWQYRPESLGLESPAWGLAAPGGGMTEWYKYAIDINDALQKHKSLLAGAMPLKSETAVIASHKNQIFDFCCTGNIQMSYSALAGIQAALYDANINSDIICAEHLTAKQLRKYKAVYYPFPYYVTKDTADMLKEYVEGGGTLISEAFFGSYKDDGYHSETIPGLGMADVFGVRETRVLKDEYVYLDPGGVRGAKYQEELEKSGTQPSGARFLAYFQNGKPAAAVNKYSKGKAVFIGSLLSCAYHNTKDENTLIFIKSLLRESGITPRLWCSEADVHVDMLTGSGGTALIFTNRAHAGIETVFYIDNGGGDPGVSSMNINTSINDIFTGETIALESKNGCISGKINIDAQSCLCYVVTEEE